MQTTASTLSQQTSYIDNLSALIFLHEAGEGVVWPDQLEYMSAKLLVDLAEDKTADDPEHRNVRPRINQVSASSSSSGAPAAVEAPTVGPELVGVVEPAHLSPQDICPFAAPRPKMILKPRVRKFVLLKEYNAQKRQRRSNPTEVDPGAPSSSGAPASGGVPTTDAPSCSHFDDPEAVFSEDG